MMVTQVFVVGRDKPHVYSQWKLRVGGRIQLDGFDFDTPM